MYHVPALASPQTFSECFGPTGWLDRLHGTDTAFRAAMKLGQGTTLGVSRRAVADAVRAAAAASKGRAHS